MGVALKRKNAMEEQVWTVGMGILGHDLKLRAQVGIRMKV